MAYIDNLGRQIDSNLSPDDLRSLIATSMKQKVGNPRPFSQKAKDEANPMAKVTALLEKTSKSFSKELAELRETIAQSAKLKSDIENRKPVPNKKEEKNLDKNTKYTVDLYKIFAKKGSGYVHDIHSEKILKEVLEELKKLNEKSTIKPPKKGGRGGGGGGSVPPGGGPAGAPAGGEGGGKRKAKYGDHVRYIDGQPIADDLAIMSHFISHIISELAVLEKHLVGFNSLYLVFDGLVSKERQFVQDIRQVAFETNNVTKESKLLNRVYEDIGKTVNQTGVDRDTFQEGYVKTLKSGIKDLKIVSSLVKTQLNTEKQLGLKAGDLSNEFISWGRSGKISVLQMSEIGRGLRDIARSSGITGDELSSVVKSSDSIMDSFKSAATFSSSAAKNVIEIQTNSKKFGAEKSINSIMNGLSSSSHLLLEASGQVQALLFSAASRVGKIDDLLNGTIANSKEGIKSMAKGIDIILKDFGVSSIDSIDQLSDVAKRQLNLSLKATFGLELGDLRATYNTLVESSKTFGDRLNDINAQRQKNLTLEEKKNLLEEERRLRTNKNLELLTILDESAKGAKDMNTAFAMFGKKRREFASDLDAMGISALKNADVAKFALEDAVKNINIGLKGSGKEELKIDSKSIENALRDPKSFRELASVISDAEQQLATAQKSQLDPMEEMAQSLRQINDTLRTYVNSTVSKLFNSVLGKIVALTTAVVGIGGGGALLYYGFKRKLDTIRRMFLEEESVIANFFKKLFNGGAATVAGGGAAGAATVAGGGVAGAATMAGGGVAGAATMAGGGVAGAATMAGGGAAGAATVAGGGATGAATVAGSAEIGSGGIKSFYDDLSKRMSEGFDSFSKGIMETTEKWAENISSGTAKFAEEVAANPLAAYKRLIINSWNTTVDIVKDKSIKIKNLISGWVSYSKDAIASKAGFFGKLSEGSAKLATGFKNLPAMGARVLNSTKGVIKNLPVLITKGLGQGLAVFTRAGGAIAGGLFRVAASMNPVSLALTGLFIGFDALTGSMSAFSRAGETFGKDIKDLTLNEEYSAKVAGMLTGILNGLTLGILGLIVPLDSWTDSLARFNAEIPVLTILLSPIVVALEAIWGVIKGVSLLIWDVIKGVYNGIKNIIMPIFQGLGDVIEAVYEIFGGTAGKAGYLVSTFRELGGVIGVVSGVIRFIGTSIGFVFESIGTVIGFVIKTIFKFIEGFVSFIKPIKEVLYSLIDGVLDVFNGIVDIVMLPFDLVKSVAKGLIYLFEPLFSLFTGEGKGFYNTVKSIGSLLGNTIGYLVKVILWPLQILSKALSFVGKTVSALASLIRGDITNAKELIGEAFGGLINAFLWPFKGVINFVSSVFGKIFNVILAPFKFIGNIFMAVINTIISSIGAFIKSFSVIAEPFKEVYLLFKDSFGEIWKGFKDVFNLISDVFSSFKDFVAPVFKWFQGEGSIFVDIMKFMGSTIAGFVKMTLKVLFTPLRLLAVVLSSIGKTIQAVVKIMRGDFTGAIGVFKDIGKNILNVLISPFKAIIDYVKDVFSNLLGVISKPFELLSSFITSMASGIMSVFVTIYDSVMNLGYVLYDSLSSAIKGVVDFALGLIPGKSLVGAFMSNEEENKKRVETEGAGLFSGIGRTLGGITGLSMGQTWGGITETASALNPFNWFDEGTRKIEKTGMGYLHQNEIVIPSTEVAKLSAEGAGKFDSAGFIHSISEYLLNTFENISSKGLTSKADALISSSYATPSATTSSVQNQDIHTAMRVNKASNETKKSAMVSPELEDISEESREQTLLMRQVLGQLVQLNKLLEPKSPVNRGSGGERGDTQPNEVIHKPANYFRNNVGLVTQTTAKGALNVGPTNV